MFENNLDLHSLHAFPCKFPAEVVKAYIEDKGSILDPFCGSGTTLLEGAIRGLDVFGFDCNPIAKLISDCKLINLEHRQISELQALALQVLEKSYIESKSKFSLHEFDGKDHWFTLQSQQEFALLLNSLSKYERNSAMWTVIATVISSITNTYSNQDSETRYAAVVKKHNEGDLLKSFSKKLFKSLEAIKKRGDLVGRNREVLLGDIRRGIPFPDDFVDQIITSPPYANTMDYYLYHKQRMNLLGFDFKATQQREIGSRHEYSSKKETKETWNKDYFVTMKEILRILKPSGRAIFVIGDSQIAGELVNGGSLTMNCAKDLGLKATILESKSMTGKSRTFRSSFQSANKFEHVVEIKK